MPGFYFTFDMYYWILVIPAMLVAVWAQARVQSAFSRYNRVYTMRGVSADIAVLLAEELQISESLLFDDFSVFIDAPYTELLHTVRKRYGLNQVDFAQKAGISPSIYAKWESGSRRPSRKMYQQLKVIYPEI